MSVTIRPTGEAYRLAREVIAALEEHSPAGCGEAAGAAAPCQPFEPHLTLQYIYGASEVERVADALEQVLRGAEPVLVTYGLLGTFDNPPGIHVDLDATPPLLDLYTRVKEALVLLGERTYPYDAQTWHPHLTLSARRWSPSAIAAIRETFPRLHASFLAERAQINRLDDGRWTTLRDVPLRAGASVGG